MHGPQQQEVNLPYECQVSVFCRGEILLFSLDETMQMRLGTLSTDDAELIGLMGAMLKDAVNEFQRINDVSN